MRRSSILSKNFGVSATLFERTLDPREIYIFKAPVPGPLGPDKLMGAEPAPQTFRTPWRRRDWRADHHGP
jgi:oxalate decarboxylase